MLKMIIYGSAKNKNIIKINNGELTDKRAKHFIHHSHKGARGIRKPEWHH